MVTCAALMNACKLTGRSFAETRVVFSGAGAAGTSIAKLLLRLGVKDIVMCDINGILCEGDFVLECRSCRNRIDDQPAPPHRYAG